MKIIDDAIPEMDFRKLQSKILSDGFPWFYGRKTRDDDAETSYRTGFFHFVVPDRGTPSSLANWLPELIQETLALHGEAVEDIWRIRLIMNTTAPEPLLNGVHTDFSRPHLTALLYLNDADGDTIVFRERWHLNHSSDPARYTVMARANPRANRLVLFDGLHLHTGTLPTQAARRVVLNVNFT